MTTYTFARRLAVHLALLAPAVAPLRAQAPAVRLGFAVDRLARIDSAFQRAVDRGEIAGAVALVWRDGQPVYEKAFGWADREAGRRMTTDALFRIASQSKALASVAVMQLVEEGKISLSDPVSRFIPAFARTTVATRTDTGRAIVPARRQITIRDLLTHTAGISYGTDSLVATLYAPTGLGPSAGYGWYTADKDEPICTTMERLAAVPFVAQPGTQFVYGYNTDILGCVVERASGMPLDRYLEARITGPLGMRDTFFFVPAEKRARLTAVYMSTDSAPARAPEGARGQGAYADGPRRSFSGGAGLVSTARDYARFLQALLDGGALGGARMLGPKTVALMTTNQTGTLFSQTGQGFGLGFQVLLTPGADGRPESVGTFSWGGAYGSQYEVDPKERLVLVYMVQLLPSRSSLGARFPMLVYQALVTPARP
ncbi:beta-lactamase [Gemmatirosa kalamazoonensis]|uniref:Beta-lactamase n=1 Tax=Gemmatirosa kalamazoonensis TaxID=861299 RepID=W0RLH6_9BACT|nr:serine hydrolase domain-containing protein [Gemmatirosa kalamazoonensis]AHG91626.1 beta-lactamase [Gemmatirosa kalamazoonensis]